MERVHKGETLLFRVSEWAGRHASSCTVELGLTLGHQPFHQRPVFAGNLNGFVRDWLLCRDCLWGRGWRDVFYWGYGAAGTAALYDSPVFIPNSYTHLPDLLMSPSGVSGDLNFLCSCPPPLHPHGSGLQLPLPLVYIPSHIHQRLVSVSFA